MGITSLLFQMAQHTLAYLPGQATCTGITLRQSLSRACRGTQGGPGQQQWQQQEQRLAG